MEPQQRTDATVGDWAMCWQHPPSFYCPISQQCMHDPVTLADGHTYERRHIERWLECHGTSPASGLQLPQKDIFPNHALRNAIEEYFQQIFREHRRAIRRNVKGPWAGEQGGLESNAALLRTMDALVQCSLLMNADLGTEYVLQQIMQEARALVGAEVASVFLVDAAGGSLYSTVNSTGSEIRIPITAGIAGHVASMGDPVIVNDAYGDCRFDKSVDRRTGFGTRNIVCVPLKVKRGVIGVVQLINKRGQGMISSKATGQGSKGTVSGTQTGPAGNRPAFTADDLHLLQVFASKAATALSNSQAFLDEHLAGPEDQQQEPQVARTASSSSQSWADKPAAGQKHRPEEAAASPGHDEPKVVRASSSSKACAEKPEAGHHEGQEKAAAAEEGTQACLAAAALLTEAFDSWDFDAFALAAATGNRPLSTLGMFLFRKLGLVERFDLDQQRLATFLRRIEDGYDDANPYHNRAHAASVLHATHALFQHSDLAGIVAPALARGHGEQGSDEHSVKLACLLAAAVHDYEHLGLTNDFLVRTMDDRATRYNDLHVNENHHIAAAFAVLARPECNFLQRMPASEFRRLRGLMIAVVLSTDMVDNGQLLKSFVTAAEAGSSPAGFVPATEQDAVLFLKIALKCCDMGHLSLNWDLHVRWVLRLEREFFAQGDREKALGFEKISFLMDRDQPGATETQVGFFDFVVNPLFEALAASLPAARPVLEGVSENYRRWKALECSPTARREAIEAARR